MVTQQANNVTLQDIMR